MEMDSVEAAELVMDLEDHFETSLVFEEGDWPKTAGALWLAVIKGIEARDREKLAEFPREELWVELRAWLAEAFKVPEDRITKDSQFEPDVDPNGKN